MLVFKKLWIASFCQITAEITQHNYITLFTYEQLCIVRIQGHPGLNQGPVDLQSNALPLSYIPMNMVTNNTT